MTRRKRMGAVAVAAVLTTGAGASLGQSQGAGDDPASFPQSAPQRDDLRGTVLMVPGAGRFAWRCTDDSRFILALIRPRQAHALTVEARADGRRVARRELNSGERLVLPPGRFRRVEWSTRERGPLGTDVVKLRLSLVVVSPGGYCLAPRVSMQRSFSHNFND